MGSAVGDGMGAGSVLAAAATAASRASASANATTKASISGLSTGKLLYRSVELCSHLSSRLGGHFDALRCERLGTLCFSCVCDGPLTRHESLPRTNFLVVPLPDSNVCALKD